MIFIALLVVSTNAQSGSSSWRGTPEEIVRQTSDHLKKHPDDAVAQFHQAVAYTGLNRLDEAKKIFQSLAEQHQDWPEPKNNLAAILLKQGELEQAQKAIDDAISSQPSFRVAQTNRNRIYDFLAARAYDKVLGNGKQAIPPQIELLTELSMNRPEVKAPPVIAREIVVEKPPAQSNAVNYIKQRLLAWSRAWSEADEKHYFSSYSTQFRPSEAGKDYTQWRNIRLIRLRNTQNTRVVLNDINVYLSDNKQRAVAEFIQDYSSATYKDRVRKQLVLAVEKGDWLILSEREIEKLD